MSRKQWGCRAQGVGGVASEAALSLVVSLLLLSACANRTTGSGPSQSAALQIEGTPDLMLFVDPSSSIGDIERLSSQITAMTHVECVSVEDPDSVLRDFDALFKDASPGMSLPPKKAFWVLRVVLSKSSGSISSAMRADEARAVRSWATQQPAVIDSIVAVDSDIPENIAEPSCKPLSS